MTALVLENLGALPVQTQSLRMILACSALDALVSARANRTVPEWQIRQVQREIDRCSRRMRGRTALVVCGTTGEAPTLSPAEHHAVTR
jgi:dihydrodipicolinate synthase/N-acetylneuraminate lyase